MGVEWGGNYGRMRELEARRQQRIDDFIARSALRLCLFTLLYLLGHVIVANALGWLA